MFCPFCYAFFPLMCSKLVFRKVKSEQHVSQAHRSNRNEKYDREKLSQHNLGFTSLHVRVLLSSAQCKPSCESKTEQIAKNPSTELSNAFAKFEKRIDRSLDDIQAKLSDVARQSSIDSHVSQLHKRLDSMEQQVRERLSDSVVRQLILLHDLVASQQLDDGPSIAIAIRNEVLEMLSCAGIEAFTVESDDFDSSRQRCIGFQDTDSQVLDGQTARRERIGFRNAHRIIRHEDVMLFKAEPQSSLTT